MNGDPTLWRYIFCGTFRRLASPRRYLALYPVEPGLSSAVKQRLPDRLPVSQYKKSFPEYNNAGYQPFSFSASEYTSFFL